MEKPLRKRHSARQKSKYYYKLKDILSKTIKQLKSNDEPDLKKKNLVVEKRKISEQLDIVEYLETPVVEPIEESSV